MAQMSERSKPQYYNIVGSESGAVLATAPYSKVLQLRNKLQKESKEKLEIILIIEE